MCTKEKSPVYLGSSFAFIVPISAAYLKAGVSGAMTGIMVVGLIYIVVSLIIKLAGKNWIDKILPPIVIGPMIMIIGLSLAPSAVSQIGLAEGSEVVWKNIIVAPIALVTMAEHIGDHTALSSIIGRNLLKEPGLDRTLLGDGLATFVAGFLGGPANTTYGENTSVVGMTKIASVWVIGLAAIFAIILGF